MASSTDVEDFDSFLRSYEQEVVEENRKMVITIPQRHLSRDMHARICREVKYHMDMSIRLFYKCLILMNGISISR